MSRKKTVFDEKMEQKIYKLQELENELSTTVYQLRCIGGLCGELDKLNQELEWTGEWDFNACEQQDLTEGAYKKTCEDMAEDLKKAWMHFHDYMLRYKRFLDSLNFNNELLELRKLRSEFLVGRKYVFKDVCGDEEVTIENVYSNDGVRRIVTYPDLNAHTLYKNDNLNEYFYYFRLGKRIMVSSRDLVLTDAEKKEFNA